jgi:periplasmic divalent cation tolerance protein
MKLVTGYVPCKNKKEAEKITKTLLKEKLIACGNIIPVTHSLYHWKGKLRKSTEALLLLKTTSKNQGKVMKRVEKLHSYDVPCVEFLPVSKVNTNYRKWVEQETR